MLSVYVTLALTACALVVRAPQSAAVATLAPVVPERAAISGVDTDAWPISMRYVQAFLDASLPSLSVDDPRLRPGLWFDVVSVLLAAYPAHPAGVLSSVFPGLGASEQSWRKGCIPLHCADGRSALPW